jgi:hydroxyethylthiazole kinase-like uncharacterized protein yjeF
MAEMDRRAIEFGIDVETLMENAGVAVARLARRMLGGDAEGRKVVCIAGKGNNGGDALVAGRHLSNWGAEVAVVLGAKREDFGESSGRQLKMLQIAGLETGGAETDFGKAELLVDGLLGYNGRGDPREPVAGLIRLMNSSGTQTLAVDLPSGLDATKGAPGDPCVRAKATVTFGLPKEGFLAQESWSFVGELYLADISFPPQIYRRFGQEAGLFGKETLVRVR